MYSDTVTQRYPLQMLQCNQDNSLLVPPAHQPLPSALARHCWLPAKQRILPVAAEGCSLRQGRSRHCLAGQLAARRAPGSELCDTVRSVAGRKDSLYTGLLHQATWQGLQAHLSWEQMARSLPGASAAVVTAWRMTCCVICPAPPNHTRACVCTGPAG